MRGVKRIIHHKPAMAIFMVATITIVLLLENMLPFASHQSLASAQTAITKTSTADWDQGTNSNVSTAGDEIKMQSNDKHAWYNSSWSYRKKITIDHTKVSAVNHTYLSDFPVLVSVASDSDLAAKALDSGNDILFTLNDEKTKLSHEIESFDGNTGSLIAWVKIPSLSPADDTILYMYYGNASSPDQRNKTDVWTNGFAGVWHYGEGSGTSTSDSTSNNNTGTLSDVSNWDAANNSKIGNGTVKGYITNPDTNALKPTNITFSAWVKAPDTSVWPVIGAKNFDWNFTRGYYLTMGPADGEFNTASFGINNQWVTTNVADNQWIYLSGTYDLSTVKLYVNGTSAGTPVSYSTAIDYFESPSLVHGGYWHGGVVRSDGQFTGSTDEFRVSSVPRSADWISTEYNNQNNPATFATLGSEVARTSLAISADNIASGWYHTDWKYRRKITIDYTKVSGAQSDFPVMVKINNASDQIFSLTQSDGDDILFADKYGSIKYSHEIDKYDATNKELIAWVRIPYLSAAENTNFYLYYGNTGVSSQQSASNVWNSNYKGVWHLPDGSLLSANDSTSNTNNGTISGAVAAEGKFNGSANFNGTSDYINASNKEIMPYVTVSAWVKRDADQAGLAVIASTQEESHHLPQYSLQFSDNKYSFYIFNSNGRDITLTSSNIAPNSQWINITGVYDGSKMNIYINGALDSTVDRAEGPLALLQNNYTMGSGQDYYGPYKNYFDGSVDDVRVSNIGRTAGWIATEYNNQNSPESFCYYGGQQTYYPIASAASWYNSSWTYRQKITIDHTKVAADQSDFPVLISQTQSANPVFAAAQKDGDDILFTSADGITKLSHEIDTYTPSTNKDLLAWVKVPSLSSIVDTVLYMYYGNQAATNQENVADVWSNGYAAVWHMNEASGNSLVDSVSGIVASPASGNLAWDSSTKLGGGSLSHANNSGSITGALPAVTGQGFTLEFWSKFTSIDQYDNFINRGDYWQTPDVENYGLVFHQYRYLMSFNLEGTESYVINTDMRGLLNNNWRQSVFRYKDGTEEIIVDNSSLATNTIVGSPSIINNYPSGSTPIFINTDIDAYFDEYRISSVGRSDSWIATGYNNQNSPSSFAVLGNEEIPVYYSSPSSVADGSGIINTGWNLGWGSPNGFSASVTVPGNTSIAFIARSSAVGGSSDSDWTAWQTLGTATETGDFSVATASMPAGLLTGTNKYLQVRAFPMSSDGLSSTGTPILSDCTFTYLADIDAPTNPSTATANIGGNSISNSSWSDQSGTVNIIFSGATDTESGIAGYYTYFGTDPNGSPSLYQAHVGSSGDNQNYSDTISSGNYYYFRVKTADKAENVSTAATMFAFGCDTVAPTNPNFVYADPEGYVTTNSYDFSWPAGSDTGGSGLKWYEYKRADDLVWSHTANSSDREISGIEAYQQGVNVFYVRSVDEAGNVAESTVQVSYYWSGYAPPKPDNLIVLPDTNDENSFTISWNKPAVNQGDPPIVAYLYSINAEPTSSNTTRVNSIDNVVTIGPSHYATQQGLNTIYVLSEDQIGNKSFETAFVSSATFTCQTAAPPTPTAVTISDASNRAIDLWALTVKWQPGTGHSNDNFGHYLIQRSEDGFNFSNLATTTSLAYVDTEGISNEYTYTYRIIEVDNAGKESVSSTEVSYQPRGNYLEPPEILNTPQVSVTSNSATISWSTDRVSSSFVRYGTDLAAITDSKGQIDAVQNHQVTLTGLSGSTSYYFQVQSIDQNRDYSLESAYSTSYSFTTLAEPIVSNVSVSNITLSSADISFETTTVSQSKIEYGLTASYGEVINDASAVAATSHQIKITGLKDSSQYHFKITSADVSGNLIISDDYSFETLPYPEISGVVVSEIEGASSQSLKIIWQTNVAATSIVKYSTSGSEEKESVKSKLEIDHEITLSDLLDSSEYNFTIQSRDQFGNLADYNVIKYHTANDTRSPVISDIIIETSNVGYDKVEKAQIVVFWKSDEPGTSKVEYGTGLSGEYSLSTIEDNSLTENHQVVISDLEPRTLIHLRVITTDKGGNVAFSGDNTAVTGESRKSVFTLIINIINRIFGEVIKL